MDIDSFTAALQAIESFWFSQVKLPSRPLLSRAQRSGRDSLG
jgi:hypothetical protein